VPEHEVDKIGAVCVGTRNVNASFLGVVTPPIGLSLIGLVLLKDIPYATDVNATSRDVKVETTAILSGVGDVEPVTRRATDPNNFEVITPATIQRDVEIFAVICIKGDTARCLTTPTYCFLWSNVRRVMSLPISSFLCGIQHNWHQAKGHKLVIFDEQAPFLIGFSARKRSHL
jgi:hypothetical protein